MYVLIGGRVTDVTRERIDVCVHVLNMAQFHIKTSATYMCVNVYGIEIVIIK